MRSVIKGTGYILVHTPDMVYYNGATQTIERKKNPDSEYLKELPKHLRNYDEALSYWPHQVYIGNKTPEELEKIEEPWYNKKCDVSNRYGKYGEIMPEEEFYLLMQASDVFDLVMLDKTFVAKYKEQFAKNELIDDDIVEKIKEGFEINEIEKCVNEDGAEGLYVNMELVGCVKKAHEVDPNLSAHVIHENLVAKASSVLAIFSGIKNAGIEKKDVDYVIDCSEEACGDMLQRGGGNFAKAEAEIAGLINATGSDARSFCAGPSHAIIEAASLVAAGTYKTIIVTAGGCTAKLGMNGVNIVKKNLPIMEDVIAGFSVVITEDDGKNPFINLDIHGKLAVGAGASPQNVIGALVIDPLEKAGLKVTDIDKFAPEMQNCEIMKAASTGDVSEANYKMIAALAVKKGDLAKEQVALFSKEKGLKAYAPIQGHIPSGIPAIGYFREQILAGNMKKCMIIGKGSLFLGRLTNLFDGVSFVIEKNDVESSSSKPQTNNASGLENANTLKIPKIAITGIGSEHGEENVLNAAVEAVKKGIDVYYIGSIPHPFVKTIKVKNDDEAHKKMEEMLNNKEIDAAVTMHFPFPIGVSTVGRVVTPARGKEILIANTTGTQNTNRIEEMIKNTICGIITAKALGIKEPTVGILNVEGAKTIEKALNELKNNGYNFKWGESKRLDGGVCLRGNDVLQGTTDIIVTDSLTGNVLTKMLSAFQTGGNFESTGYGYGPGIGENYDKLVLIVSRASGTPVLTNAICFASEIVKNNILKIAKEEFEKAKKAGLSKICEDIKSKNVLQQSPLEDIKMPKKEPVSEAILGIDVMELEDAVKTLWKENIYAESGMGCTGPVVMISYENLEKAKEILQKEGFIQK